MNELETRLERRIRNQYSQELVDWLWIYMIAIERLLENGETIYINSKGQRCERLHQLRLRLYSKMHTLSIVIGHINNVS